MNDKDSTEQLWRPSPLIRNPYLRWAIILVTIGYLVAALNTFDVNWERVVRGAERIPMLFSGFLTPDFVSRWSDIQIGILESLAMTLVATFVGCFLGIPLSLAAAKNIAHPFLYIASRGFIVVSRSFQEIIIAIFFVIVVGFGPLAGVLTLIFATVGFIGKLLAEDIEDIDPAQLEAIRATGASHLQVILYAVVPQALPRFVGLSIYRLDINFRESSVIGIVGAGGIGATLNTAFSRYEYSVAAAMVIIVIALVLITEYFSTIIRRRLQ